MNKFKYKKLIIQAKLHFLCGNTVTHNQFYLSIFYIQIYFIKQITRNSEKNIPMGLKTGYNLIVLKINQFSSICKFKKCIILRKCLQQQNGCNFKYFIPNQN